MKPQVLRTRGPDAIPYFGSPLYESSLSLMYQLTTGPPYANPRLVQSLDHAAHGEYREFPYFCYRGYLDAGYRAQSRDLRMLYR